MHPLLRIPYAAIGGAARAASALAPAGDAKLLASLRARRGVLARFTEWGSRARDVRRPLVWLHAPSVGEGLQARPVIERLRQRHPDWQIAYTFFSPSAERFAKNIGADFCDYLPFDTRGAGNAALDALRPGALVFSKLDVWPALTERASARGVRLGLVSATLAASSARGSALGSLLLRDAYRALDAVGAISEDDAERLQRLGVRAASLSVTGDARYDEAWSRAQSTARHGALLDPLRSARPTLVAGSTWPSDEAHLLDAWTSVVRRMPEARLVIAPHEPRPSHLEPIVQWASAAGLRCARLGDPASPDACVVLVDRVGVLGDLYALAHVAYVGGGFHAAGLHSVIEPAAFGAPVLFGPRHQASRDAGLLMERGGGFTASSAGELAARILALLSDPAARDRAGANALATVQSGLGAAERSTELVERLLTR